MSLTAGQRIGPYEILSPLAAGGMGEVYRARDPRLGREVAVKVLPAGFLGGEDSVRRFEQEAKAAGALNHPHVLTVHDAGTHGETPYIVSELLEGETLRKRLETGALPPRKALEYGAQAARGLAAAHDKGIVHRDLKPDNLFLTKEGFVKILDFGLAKQTRPPAGDEGTRSLPSHPATDPGTVLGTVGYMSPEQVRGLPADSRSDIFALGAVLYEMLTGRRAFQGETATDTLRAILREDPPELTATRPEIAPGLERIVMRCLEKTSGERFQSARDVAFALEALSGTTGATAAVAARPPRVWRYGLLIGLGLAGLALAAFLGRFTAPRPEIPSFKQLTFRRGCFQSARFAPDGKTVVYSAAWDGGLPEVYVMHSGSPESNPVGLQGAHVQAVSSNAELLVLMSQDPSSYNVYGTLARLSLSGGTPRLLLENVLAADWGPDGKNICVLRKVEDQVQIEYPLGNVLYRRRGEDLQFLRVSPKGDNIAFLGSEGLEVMDRSGKRLLLRTEPSFLFGLAWSPDGSEIWFTAGTTAQDKALYAVSLNGRQRTLAKIAGTMTIADVSSAGDALIFHGLSRTGVMASRPDDPLEHDVSVFDRSRPRDLSPDGNILLISERGAGSSIVGREGAYLRRTDGTAAVRLGDGTPMSLSPDANWVLCANRSRLVRLPVGAGEPGVVDMGSLTPDRTVMPCWLGDARRFIASAAEPGRKTRLFVVNLDGARPQPVTPEGVSGPFVISPDARFVAVAESGVKIRIFPVEGGDPQEIPGTEARGLPIQWTADLASLYVRGAQSLPVEVDLLDIRTGRRTPWKRLIPSDAAGIAYILDVLVTPDGRGYAYGYGRHLVDLYLLEGVR